MISPHLLVEVLLASLAIVLTVIAACTTFWQMHAWGTPEAHQNTGFRVQRGPRRAGANLHDGVDLRVAERRSVTDYSGERRRYDDPSTSFSLIMPCREEPYEVMESTLMALLLQTHPDFEVILSLGHDDLQTIADAEQLASMDTSGRTKVSINYDLVKNKPRQLNSSIGMVTKQVVGIIDAESVTHPELLVYIDSTLKATGADVVQGAVQLMNVHDRWFTLRSCLEYRTWFRSRLHGHADAGFIPLGGNTVFTRTSVIEQVDGWDGNCLAEDCEIGVRLSAIGKKIVCAYDPNLTTLEEAPVTIPALIKQRTRWALGYMQVLSKGEWKKLPTRRGRFLAWWTLVQQHAMALAGIALPLALVTALTLPLSMPVVLITFLPAVPTIVMVSFEVLILREFGKDMNLEITFRDYVTMILSTPFYQFLLALASCRAFWKFLTGDFAWEKTEHKVSQAAKPLFIDTREESNV